MKTSLILFTFILTTRISSAQMDSLYGEIKVVSVKYDGVNLVLSSPKTIILTHFRTSEIISVGVINGQEIGLQAEILKSNLNDSISVVAGKGYFLKQNGNWKMVKIKNFYAAPFKWITDKKDINENEFTNCFYSVTDSDTKKELTFHFLEYYYLFQK